MGNREDISKKIYPSDKLQQSYEIVLTVMVFSPGGDIGESDASIRSGILATLAVLMTGDYLCILISIDEFKLSQISKGPQI